MTTHHTTIFSVEAMEARQLMTTVAPLETETLTVDPSDPSIVASRHTGGANFSFADGSVRFVKSTYNPYITVDYIENVQR